MKHLRKTQPFRGPKGEVVPGSIAEVKYLCLGGLDQWVMIRGESLMNPPLILLHGGPGFPETHFFRHFNAPLDTYSHVTPGLQEAAAKRFEEGLLSAVSKPSC
jgi:pimeloyl-ACP methyl ester carboxylesterase